MKKLLEENETLTQSVNDACPGLPIFKPNFAIFFFLLLLSYSLVHEFARLYWTVNGIICQ